MAAPSPGIAAPLLVAEDGKAWQCLIDCHVGRHRGRDPGGGGASWGRDVWKRRVLRNLTFGASPAIIALNDHPDHTGPALPAAWQHFRRIGGWNEIRAPITGDPLSISTLVNGVQSLRHAEPQSLHPAHGHIGLQVHGGEKYAGAGTVRCRNLRVRML